MFKVYTVNGQEYEVSNEKESQFLQEFPNAELIEDTVSTPTETVTQEEVVSQPQVLQPSPVNLEENAEGTQGIPTPNPVNPPSADDKMSPEELYNKALDVYYDSKDPTGITKYVAPQIANFIGMSADLLNGVAEDIPKFLMKAAAGVILPDEDIDEEEERVALDRTVDSIYDFVGSIPIVGKFKTIADATEAISDSSANLTRKEEKGKDWWDNFADGDYGEGTRMLTQDIAGAVPSVLAAFTPYGIVGLGGIAAADKFEQGYQALEGKEDDWSNIYGAATVAGLVETATALTTRGLGKTTTFVADKLGVPAAKSVIGHFATKFGAGAVQEGIEESAAAWADKAIDKWMLGDEDAMDNVYKEMRRQGIVGSIMGGFVGGGSRSRGKKFTELTKEQKELLTNGLQPRELSRKQGEKEKQIVNNSLKLKSLKNDPILYKAKEEEIIRDYNSLNESKQQINNQFAELSPSQLQRMQEISNELGELDLYTSEISNTETQVETAKNKIKQLEQEQQDIFLNPDGLDIQRAQPVLEENIKLSNDTQKLYGVPAGKDSEKADLNSTQINKIIDKQLGLINKTAIETVGSFGKEGDIAEMVSQLKYGPGGMVDMIKTYNPSTGVPLSAYLANPRTGLPQRAKRLVKKVTQQDISLDDQLGTPESLTQKAFDTDFDVTVGSNLLADRIGLNPETITEARNIVEKGLVSAESKLMDNNLTPKKRLSEANKAFTKPFKDRISKDIKEIIGKGKDFDNFVDKNWKPIAQAFIAQNQVSKGTGVSKEWAKFPPSKQQVVDYFTGKDLKVGAISPKTGKPLTAGQIGRAISTRKTRALTEALASHIGIEARNEFFKDNPKIRKQFQEDTKIQWKADARVVSEKVAQEYYEKQDKNIVKNIKDPKPGYIEKMKELGKQGLSAFRGGKKLWTTKKVTQSDLNNNPQWAEAGIEIGHNIYNESNIETLKEQLGSTISKIPKNLSDILGVNNVYALVGKKNRAFDPAKVTKPSVLDITQEDVIAEYQSKYDSDLFTEESAESIRKSLGGSPKWLVSADGSVKRIKPGDPGVGYEFFKDKEELAKDVQELYDKGEISKESYNEYKKINFDNVQLQNTQFKKKGTLLGDAIDIAKSDKYKTKEERQAAFNKLWPPDKIKAVGDANHQLMKFYVSLLKNEYKKGNISEDALTTLLQWQSSIVEGFRSLTGFNAVYFTDGPSEINKGEHLKPNALSMAQLKNNITGAPNAKTLDEIVKGHMQAFGPSKLFDQVDKLGKTTAMPGLERIVFGIGPNEANNFYDPTTKKTFLQMRLEEMAKQAGVGIDEAYAQLYNDSETGGSLVKTIESVIDVSKIKMYKKALDEKAPQLNQEETVKGFIDILQGNWNKDGKTRLEAFTDPEVMADILMNEFNQNEIQAKEGVKHFGFKIGNKIYINLAAGKGIETAIHESGHLWNSIVHQGAPKIWNGIMSRVKEAGMWDPYIKQIEKSPSTYGDILKSYNDGSNTFDLENEVFARILEEYGGKKITGPKTNLQKIKDIVGKYFNELKTMLGFDPTTKNFGDLTVKEMIDLAVSEVVTGNPLANFSQLKDSQNEPWFVKTHQEVSPTFKVESNPEFQALKQLQKEYRDNNYDLTKAIENSYQQVKDIMPFEDWAQFVQNTISETDIKVGETVSGKALLVAKKDAIENEKTRVNQLKVLRDNGLFTEGDQFLPTQLLNEKLRKADNNIIEEQKKKSEGLNKNLRKILNNKSGFGKKPSKWFVPSNAEDFKGLLYALLPGGKDGVAAKKFFKSTLIDPYHKGVAASEAEILQKIEKYSKISKGVDLTKKIKGTPYNIGDAVKVRNWVEEGIDIDIKKQEYIDALVDTVNNDVDLQSFANIIQKDFPIEYNAEWRNDSFNKSIYQNINSGSRARHLEIFSNNVDNVFDKDNLREIENIYGKDFRQALQNSLKRMKTGKNRVSTDSQSNKFLTWVNRAVATTMFINTRSAALQLLSSLNYIGKPNNNIFKATTALGPGWRKDFNKLWNSPYLKNRREGAKFDVLADEIAEKGEKGLNKLLKFGFLPTRYADSFAIALGGAAYYRNTKSALIKEGMNPEQAEKAAMQSWIEATEESQQSADPAMISEIQSSNVGKLIYAFANTPFQYIRKSKRHLQDIVSGRSAAEGGTNQVRKDLQSVLYYTVGQAMMFNALQSALFAVAWEDDEEKKKALLSDKEALIIERALTSYMKSMGNPGAIAGALYSMIAEGSEQIKKKGRIDNAYKVALEATSISPPLNAKLRDLVAIGNIYKYNYKEIQENPLKPSVDNPTFEIAGNAASFVGVPLDRVIRKAQNLSAIANEEAETWQKVFQVLGWNEWDFYSPTYQAQQRKAQKEKNKYMPSSLERIQKYNQMSPEEKKAYTQKRIKEGKPLFKKEGGVKILGKAHKDGTIEIASGLSPEKRKQVVAHENKHKQDMQSGKLDYSKDWIRWGNQHFKRTPDKRVVYKGKKYIEGHPKLPWEAAANKAESRVS